MKSIGHILIFLSFLTLVHCGQPMESLKSPSRVESTTGERALLRYNDQTRSNPLAITLNVVESCDSSSLSCKVIEKINQIRLSYNLSSLKIYKACENAAYAHAQDMALYGYFEHIGRDGSTPRDRLARYGSIGYGVAENIGRGTEDADAIVQAWMDSPSHRASILNAKITHTGVGIAHASNSNSINSVYYVQCFLMN